MHDLEKSIAKWRKTMMAAPAVSHETLDELENHLRENVEQLVRSGMAKPEALERAVAQLGGAPMIVSEFQKLHRSTWLPVKLVIGFDLILALAMVIFLAVRLDAGRTNFLLASHVLAVTLGYGTTFLVGALGICFVGQRCFSDFSPSRMPSLTRFTFILGCVAASMTVLGTLLGMIWTRVEWGRYWAWDIKEIGAFAVILWQVSFLCAHRFARGTARGILTLSLVGNIIVSLGWFGSNLLSRPGGDWALHHSWLLLAGVVANLVLFVTGLGPAGWLRLRGASLSNRNDR